MPHMKTTFALAALAALMGATGLAGPVMAREAEHARIVRSVPSPERMPRKRADRIAQIEAMRQASVQTRPTKIVPGSDSIGESDAHQTLAVASGLYAR